jgi:hypothetical protein
MQVAPDHLAIFGEDEHIADMDIIILISQFRRPQFDFPNWPVIASFEFHFRRHELHVFKQRFFFCNRQGLVGIKLDTKLIVITTAAKNLWRKVNFIQRI